MLNKSQSFLTGNLKVNPIQIGLSKRLQKAQGWEGAHKKAYVGVKEMKLGIRV